jgi:hypothetical protein
MGESSRLRKRRPRLNTKPQIFAGRCWLAFGLLAAWLFFCPARLNAQTNPWRDHLTRDEVLAALGEPNSDLRGGGQEMMVYKDGLTINFLNGEVSSITGTVPDSLKPGAAAAPAAAASAPTAPAKLAPAAATAPAAKPVSGSPAMAVSSPSAGPAGPGSTNGDDQDNEKIINDFSTKSLIPPDTPLAGVVAKEFGPQAGASAADTSSIPPSLAKLLPQATPESPWTAANTLQGFLAGLLLRTVVMTLVLKGAFAYKEFPVIWREVALVGAGVALCNQLMAYIFTLNDFLKMLGWIQADQLLTGVLLLALIMNCTSAKQLPTAAGIMMATMSANIALGYAMQLFF